jgi:hypothetical protein
MRNKYNLGTLFPKDRYITVREKGKKHQMVLLIFSYDKYSYQMDTYENKHECSYFLMLININTRKGYAFPMKNKSTESAMASFEKLNIPINSFYSYQDTAYSSKTMT